MANFRDWSLIDGGTSLSLIANLIWTGRERSWRCLFWSLLFNVIASICWSIDWLFVKLYLSRKYQPSGIRIQRILWRHKIDEMALAADLNFICLHEKYASSFEELMSPNWMLYSFSEKTVHFVELPKQYDQYQAQQAPFCYIHQFNEATRLATMSTEDFLLISANVSIFDQL
jgi:hypothetical protein